MQSDWGFSSILAGSSALLLGVACSSEQQASCECAEPPAFVIHLPADRTADLAGASFVGEGCGATNSPAIDGGSDLRVFGRGTCKVTLTFRSSPPVQHTATFHFVDGCCGGWLPTKDESFRLSADASVSG